METGFLVTPPIPDIKEILPSTYIVRKHEGREGARERPLSALMFSNNSLQATPMNCERAWDGTQSACSESFRGSVPQCGTDYVISPACLSL